jgi:hypothetical protein
MTNFTQQMFSKFAFMERMQTPKRGGYGLTACEKAEQAMKMFGFSMEEAFAFEKEYTEYSM